MKYPLKAKKRDIHTWQQEGNRIYKLKPSGEQEEGKNHELVDKLINDFSIEVTCNNCTRTSITAAREILLAEHIAELLNANPCTSISN